jgi:hypothetical protein
MMRDAGFVNIIIRIFHIPIGGWPENKVLRKVGLCWRAIVDCPGAAYQRPQVESRTGGDAASRGKEGVYG